MSGFSSNFFFPPAEKRCYNLILRDINAFLVEIYGISISKSDISYFFFNLTCLPSLLFIFSF